MTKTLALLAAALIPAIVQAAPFVVSDPLDPAVTHCGFKTDAAARTDVPVALSGTDKICKLDVGSLTIGSHTVSATAVAIDPTWGTLGRRESVPSATFTFTVPAVPPVPSGLRLQP